MRAVAWPLAARDAVPPDRQRATLHRAVAARSGRGGGKLVECPFDPSLQPVRLGAGGPGEDDPLLLVETFGKAEHLVEQVRRVGIAAPGLDLAEAEQRVEPVDR